MRLPVHTCEGTGQPPLTAFSPHICAVCERYVYVNRNGRVAAHERPAWQLAR